MDDMETAKPKGSAFYRALHGEYVKLAKIEAKKPDMFDALKYADRAIKSAKGGPQFPEAMHKRKLPKSKVRVLQSARNRLTVALIKSGRKKAPKDAARAQAMFDCWMEEQEENNQPKDIARCKKGFEKSLAKVLKALKKKKRKPKRKPKPMAKPMPKPMPKPTTASFIVYFDFNSAKITASGEAVIAKAVKWVKSRGAGSVSLRGHTDRAGKNAYNLKLSKRRTKAVADAIIGGDIGSHVIRSDSSGEEQPAVATPDGKAEARNRRVVIRVSQ